MTKILIVDDEKLIRDMILKYARHEGYETLEASDGEEALELFKRENFDVVILDVMMPKMDGFKTLQKMKEIRDVHCIFLTAMSQEDDRIYGFDSGADDYVTKPFSPKELMLRIKVILRRNNISTSQKYIFDGLVIDSESHTLSIDGEVKDIANKEFELLLYLVENAGKAVTRENIILKVWGYECDSDTRTLDTHMKLLRKDLGKYESLITTIRGVGYRFEKKD